MEGLVLKGVVASLVALAAAAVAAVGTANAYPTLGVCQYDAPTNMNSCSFHNPDGIQSVFISLNTDDGIQVVVNEIYDCETPVFVQWENLGPTHHFEVEACPPDPAVPPAEDPPIGQRPLPPEPPRGVGGLTGPELGTPDGETVVISGLTDVPYQSAEAELLILVTPRIVR